MSAKNPHQGQHLCSEAAAPKGSAYQVDPETPNEVVMRDERGKLLKTIEVRLVYPLGISRKPGEVCETARKIAAALNGDYRALNVAFIRERSAYHKNEVLLLDCGASFLSAEQRAAIDWHERQARALHHEAELLDKSPL